MDDQQTDFSLLLASSVHDMKNSLGMLLSTLEDLVLEYPPETEDHRKRYGMLEGEAFRIKNDLTYLLGLYRLENHQLAVEIDEVFVLEFLQCQLAANEILFTMRNLQVSIDCDDSLAAYFDEELLAGVVNNVLVNAARYANESILIKAAKEGKYLCIDVIDDGEGFPLNMIKSQQGFVKGISFRTGSTNLGLHFAAKIAALHKRGDVEGYIELQNEDAGGGRFRIYLP